jgi:hypothetical protein
MSHHLAMLRIRLLADLELHLAKRRPAVSKPKIFLQRVGEAEQQVFLKWAADDLEAYRERGICPATGDRKGR